MATTAPKFQTAYRPTVKPKVTCDPKEGRTQQQFKDECDINVIINRIARGESDYLTQQKAPQYGDATSQDFHQMQNTLAEMKSHFEELPSKVRKHFNHDVGEYLDACHDPERTQEFVELGLLPPEQTPVGEDAKGIESPVGTETDPSTSESE